MIKETPYYLFDKQKFYDMVKKYKSYGKVFYPVKANDDEIIISIINDNDCCFEVDSLEHIKLLINEHGIDPRKLLYSYPIKERADINEALKMGVTLFVIDSIDEYNKIISISSTAKLVIRINVLQIIENNLSPEKDKWGLDLEDAKKLISYSKEKSINIAGISFYIMAEIENKNSFEIILETLITNFKGADIEFLNIGGGISIEQLDILNHY